jgi:hypothetical protein
MPFYVKAIENFLCFIVYLSKPKDAPVPLWVRIMTWPVDVLIGDTK